MSCVLCPFRDPILSDVSANFSASTRRNSGYHCGNQGERSAKVVTQLVTILVHEFKFGLIKTAL